MKRALECTSLAKDCRCSAPRASMLLFRVFKYGWAGKTHPEFSLRFSPGKRRSVRAYVG